MRTAAMLATALVAGLFLPTTAVAAPSDRVTASASVPGKDPQTVVMPGGTVTVTYTSAGLTKYAVGPHSIKRLGTAKVPHDPAPFAPHTVLAHPSGRFVYVVWTDRIQVFDASERTPRLVRTVTAARVFPDMDRPSLGRAAFDPEGRRLFVKSAGTLKVLGTKRPTRPTIGTRTDLPEGIDHIAVTPDGSRLVAVGSADREAFVAVYSLPRVGAPTPERQGTLSVPGWPPPESPDPDDWSIWGGDVVPAPGGRSAYVSVSTWGYGDTPDEAVLKVRLSDLSSVALPDRGPSRTPLLQDVSANGKRVYVTYGSTTDEGYHIPRDLAWVDSDLTAWHDADPVGDVVDTAVSKAGPTRGLVYVVVKTKRGLQLRSVKVG